MLMLLAPPAWTGNRRPVSALELDRFMVDWPRFVNWAREHGEEFDRPEAPDTIFEELLGLRATEFIKSMGWEKNRFSQVLERITAVLSGLNMRAHRDKIKAAHGAERIEIENNPNLTESDRSGRLAALEESWNQLEKYEALLGEADPGEVELIRINQEKLMEILKKVYQGS